MLVRRTFKDQVEIIKSEVKVMSGKQKRKNLLLDFNALNNVERYRYFWQKDTGTYFHLVRFLFIVDSMRKETGYSFFEFINEFLPFREKSYQTLWLIVKTANKKKHLLGLKCDVEKDDTLENMRYAQPEPDNEVEINYDKARAAWKLIKKFEHPFEKEDI